MGSATAGGVITESFACTSGLHFPFSPTVTPGFSSRCQVPSADSCTAYRFRPRATCQGLSRANKDPESFQR